MKTLSKVTSGLLALGLIAACTSPPQELAPQDVSTAPSPLSVRAEAILAAPLLNPESADAFTARCTSTITLLEEMIAKMETDTSPASQAYLKDYDLLLNLAMSVGFGEASIASEANPNTDIRDAGSKCTEDITAITTQISLSRPIYERLTALQTLSLEESERFFLARTLDSYRRTGVDKDEATREKVKALNAELAQISTAFSKNLREAKGSIKLTSVDQLAGLPQDYIDAHPPGEDGLITLTTDYPDVGPFLLYSANDELKKEYSYVYGNRAYPENDAVLRSLLEKRYELAQTLGYDTYADLVMEDKMTGSPAVAESFLKGVEDAARSAAKIEHDRLLAKLRETKPDAARVPSWSATYLSEQIRQSDYALNAQEVREYFAYDNVTQGIFTLVEDVFEVNIRPWADAPVWHEDVTAYEMYLGDALIGRFFLDMHPRDGKFKHAAAFPIRFGPTMDGVPMASLMCNFPQGDHTTGLMEHGQVETYLHEFGHLIHMMLSAQPEYANLFMGNLEWDFIEAPSQMLENWVWDYDTLATFAVNAEGETIPAELVEKMNAAKDFGLGLGTLRQLVYAGVSLNYYNQPPENVDFMKIWKDWENALSPLERQDNIHPYAAFGHLDGYSAIYYTYQWSLAISTDLFSQFETNGLNDAETAQRYRDLILAKGSTKPAGDLVKDFLGREWTPDAYEAQLLNAAKTDAPE